MLASLSFNRDAKRVSIINLVFNIFGAILFTILYLLLPFDQIYFRIAPNNVVVQIAMMHTIVAVVSAIVFFPFGKIMTNISYLVIPDQGTKKTLQPEVTQAAKIENNTVFNIFGLNIEINNMFDIVKQSIYISFNALLEHYSIIDAVRSNKGQVNRINKGISKNLMLLMAADTNMQESRQAASLFSINVDLKRMSDHTMNVAEAEEKLVLSDLPLSVAAYDELNELANILMQSLGAIDDIISTGEYQLIELVRKNEDLIDRLCLGNKNNEIQRMKDGVDEAESGIIYTELLIDIERIGDHIVNIAENLCESYQDL